MKGQYADRAARRDAGLMVDARADCGHYRVFEPQHREEVFPHDRIGSP